MTEFWFKHLSATLKDNNIVAYMWDVGEDSFQWAGDLHGFLGLEPEDYPVSSTQFNKMINPQETPQRLAILYDILVNGSSTDEGMLPSFSMGYKLRHSNGSYIEVDETATVRQDMDSGGKLVCGFLKIRMPEQVPAAVAPERRDNVVPALSDFGSVSQGRQRLQRRIEEWFDTNKGGGSYAHGYVLSVGIDRMALFNDVMGSRYADELLEKTGMRLSKIVGDSGTVMRINGDVYGIFFKQAPHNEMAAVAKYILNSFYNMPLQTSMGPMGIGISIGGVTLDQAKEPTSVITMAEMAMNVAKDKGRSCFVSYDEASHKAESSRMLLKSADAFLRAIKTDRLRLAFQPVMGSKGEQVSFHESLIRLIGEDGRVIPAGAFIPAVEELGLARLVDQHALQAAVDDGHQFVGEGRIVGAAVRHQCFKPQPEQS